MQHRDIITLKKIVSEADFVIGMISNIEQSEFIEDEILKRAAAMSVIINKKDRLHFSVICL